MTPALAEYITESASWAVVGFVGGYILGRVALTAPTGAMMTSDPPDATGPAHARRHRWRPTGQQLLGIVVFILALVTVAQGLIQTTVTRRIVECQQQYANQFADALDARTAASNNTQNALDTLVSTVGHVLDEPPSAQASAELSHAVTAYLNTRATLKREQQEHPYPPAPRDLCP